MKKFLNFLKSPYIFSVIAVVAGAVTWGYGIPLLAGALFGGAGVHALHTFRTK